MKPPKTLTFIGRDGHTTRMPDLSGERYEEIARETGLQELLESGGRASPGDLMNAMMAFEKLAGIERFDEPPADVVRAMMGEDDPDAEDGTDFNPS